MNETLPLYVAGVGVLAAALPRLKRRLELSRAKHPSLTGHSRMAKRVARLIPYYEYDEAQFFAVDGAPDEVVQLRRLGFARLAELFRTRFAHSAALAGEAAEGISDLQFTASYRVPFQFSRYVRERLKGGGFLQASAGVKVTDLDGNELYDLTGSYGVNVFGYDFYRNCIAEGSARVAALGPVLGAYHPVVADNVRRLRAISGLDEVSFHMSGTEAVMQAVRLARYHTGRRNLVRFCGAYHGWWEDVQPGIGNPLPPRETYTLKEMDADSLKVLDKIHDQYWVGDTTAARIRFGLQPSLDLFQKALFGLPIGLEPNEKYKADREDGQYVLTSKEKKRFRRAAEDLAPEDTLADDRDMRENRLERTLRRAERKDAVVYRYWIEPDSFLVTRVLISDLGRDQQADVRYLHRTDVNGHALPDHITLSLSDSTKQVSAAFQLDRIGIDGPLQLNFRIPEKFTPMP